MTGLIRISSFDVRTDFHRLGRRTHLSPAPVSPGGSHHASPFQHAARRSQAFSSDTTYLDDNGPLCAAVVGAGFGGVSGGVGGRLAGRGAARAAAASATALHRLRVRAVGGGGQREPLTLQAGRREALSLRQARVRHSELAKHDGRHGSSNSSGSITLNRIARSSPVWSMRKRRAVAHSHLATRRNAP